jgi:hypothetical protein
MNKVLATIVIERLGNRVASGALFDSAERHSPPKCHPHTREVVLKAIMEWVDDPANRGHIMWITGAPGVGKSAVAEKIAEIYSNAGKLAACCFFSRTSTGRNSGNLNNFVTTLAYQLFHAIPEIQDSIIKLLQADLTILDNKEISHQTQALIIKPLNDAVVATAADNRQVLESRPRVVVIDAIDECPDSPQRRLLLETLAILSKYLRFPLIFLVTSRREKSIQAAFDAEPLLLLTTLLDLDAHNPDSDIERFLKSRFQEIKQSHPAGYALPTPWPSKEQIDVLVKRSSGQFRYATTVIDFVGSLHYPPSYRLDIVLSPLVGAEISSSPLEALQLQISAANKKHSKSSWFSLSNITK